MSRARDSFSLLDISLPAQTDSQRERKDVIVKIQKFLNEIKSKVKPDVFLASGPSSLPDPITDSRDVGILFHLFFTDSVAKMDDRELNVMIVYADYMRQILSFLIENGLSREKVDGMTLMKFICISLFFGPDRAIRAVAEKDNLWTEFRNTITDVFYKKLANINFILQDRRDLVQRASIIAMQAVLDETRNIYYTFLRDDYWDARKEDPSDTLYSETSSETSILEKSGKVSKEGGGRGLAKSGESVAQLDSLLTKGFRTISKQPTHAEECARAAPSHDTPAVQPSAWAAKQPVTFEYRDYPEFVYRQNTPVDATAGCTGVVKTLEKYHVPATSLITGLALGVSSGVASGIGNMTKEGKERAKPVLVPAPRPSLKDDMRVSSFDYDIHGTNIDEILGSVFRKTCFINEGARQETMKVILQRVLDDPETPDTTKEVALKQIDQMDVPKMHAQMSHLSALKAAKVFTKENADLERIPSIIPPPTFGNQTMTTNTVKSLFASMGIDSNQKFSIADPECKPLKYYLIPLAAKITSERLSEDQAYLLLSNIVTGSTLEQVQNAMYNDYIPFSEFWIFLQKTGNRTTSVDAFQRELDKVLKTTPEHVENAITKIKNLRIKIHMNEPDEAIRKKMTETQTIIDFRKFLRNHFPFSAALVDFLYKQKVSAQEMEELTNGVFNTAFPMPNKVYTYMEVMCSVLADEGKLSVLHPVFPIGGSKHERAKVSAIAAEKPKEEKVGSNNTEEGSSSTRRKKSRKKANVAALQGEAQAEVCSFAPQPQQRDFAPNRDNQYRPQQQQQNRQDYPRYRSNDQSRQEPRGPCILCTKLGHTREQCWRYPHPHPVANTPCTQCNGRHSGECRQNMSLGNVNNGPRPASGRFYNRGNNNDRGYQARNDDPALTTRGVEDLLKKRFDEYHQKMVAPLVQGLGNQGQQGIPPAAHLSYCQAHHP